MRASRSSPSLSLAQTPRADTASTRATSKSTSKKASSKKTGGILLSEEHSPNKENSSSPNNATWSRGTSKKNKKKRTNLLLMCVQRQTEGNDEFFQSSEGSSFITGTPAPTRATGRGLPPPPPRRPADYIKSNTGEHMSSGAKNTASKDARWGMPQEPSPTLMLEADIDDVPLPTIMPHRMLGAPPSDKMPHEVPWGGSSITLPPKKPRKPRSNYFDNLMKRAPQRKRGKSHGRHTEERKVSSCGKVLTPPNHEKYDGVEP